MSSSDWYGSCSSSVLVIQSNAWPWGECSSERASSVEMESKIPFILSRRLGGGVVPGIPEVVSMGSVVVSSGGSVVVSNTSVVVSGDCVVVSNSSVVVLASCVVVMGSGVVLLLSSTSVVVPGANVLVLGGIFVVSNTSVVVLRDCVVVLRVCVVVPGDCVVVPEGCVVVGVSVVLGACVVLGGCVVSGPCVVSGGVGPGQRQLQWHDTFTVTETVVSVVETCASCSNGSSRARCSLKKLWTVEAMAFSKAFASFSLGGEESVISKRKLRK